jgi:hypothetical protein
VHGNRAHGCRKGFSLEILTLPWSGWRKDLGCQKGFSLEILTLPWSGRRKDLGSSLFDLIKIEEFVLIGSRLPFLSLTLQHGKREQEARWVACHTDSCLVFNVLIHNDAKEGRPNLRLLDLSENHITPTIVMNIAHKHLGTNKGLSTIAGTKGALSIPKRMRESWISTAA